MPACARMSAGPAVPRDMSVGISGAWCIRRIEMALSVLAM